MRGTRRQVLERRKRKWKEVKATLQQHGFVAWFVNTISRDVGLWSRDASHLLDSPAVGPISSKEGRFRILLDGPA